MRFYCSALKARFIVQLAWQMAAFSAGCFCWLFPRLLIIHMRTPTMNVQSNVTRRLLDQTRVVSLQWHGHQRTMWTSGDQLWCRKSATRGFIWADLMLLTQNILPAILWWGIRVVQSENFWTKWPLDLFGFDLVFVVYLDPGSNLLSVLNKFDPGSRYYNN